MAQKEKTYRSKKYTSFVDQLPCEVETCLLYSFDSAGEYCEGLVTHHHTDTGGTGMKGSDLSCIPLCSGHHMDLTTAIHRGKETFARIYGIDIEKAVIRTNQLYIQNLEGKK